jgi:hypothetical protein
MELTFQLAIFIGWVWGLLQPQLSFGNLLG